MRKALLLGAIAFFALNLATVQNINAQERQAAKPQATTVGKNEKDKPIEKKDTPDPKAKKKLSAAKTKSIKEAKDAKQGMKTSSKEIQKAIKKEPSKNDPKNQQSQTVGTDERPNADVNDNYKPSGKNDKKMVRPSKNDPQKPAQMNTSDEKNTKNGKNGKNDNKQPSAKKLKSAKNSTIK